jgi:aryl-alcohol dehydrogenase-like predicted oxidoreductase
MTYGLLTAFNALAVKTVMLVNKAIDCGVNFIDTADVYGDGRSERLVAQLKKHRKEEIVVATKAGRRLPEQTDTGYDRDLQRLLQGGCQMGALGGKRLNYEYYARRKEPSAKFLYVTSTWRSAGYSVP